MKPINFDASACNPISSNCVIWQGPDIPIINLCSGDSISDVVFALATELQLVMDQINVSNYDLSCFNITNCKPDDFNALIQFLITKICELEGVTPTTAKSTGCPECMVSVPSCLNAPEPLMNLVDYVNFLANKICTIIQNVDDLTTRVTNLETAVTTIQNTPPPTLNVPPVNITCSATTFSSNQVWTVVQEFINNYWCPFIQVAGTPTSIFDSLNPDCPYPTLVPAITPATTIAEALTNIWRVLCNLPTVVVAGVSPGITVTSATVGNQTTYSVKNNYLETFWANVVIGTVSGNVASGSIPQNHSVDNLTQGQIIEKYNVISSNNVLVTNIGSGGYVANSNVPPCTFGVFDNDGTLAITGNLKGAFLIQVAGTYLFQGSCHLKSNANGDAVWQTTGVGTFGLGLLNTGDNIWGGQFITAPNTLLKQFDISAAVTAYVPANTIVRLSALNYTDRNYNGTGYAGADTIKFSITRLR